MKDMKTIGFQKTDKIATITLNRPDDANGINMLLAEELAYCANECSNDETLKAVILTGRGRFFSAGGDVKEMASYSDEVGEKIKQLADTLHEAISAFAHMQVPVITAVNGMAAGAGFSLAITGDIVIASDKAALMMAYTNAGLSPDGSSSYYLPRLVGIRRAQELMLTNRKLTAHEALDWGLITQVVPHDQLMERARGLANSFVNGAALANTAVKKLLLCSFDNSLETQMDLESNHISQCAQSANGREGISAFTTKRKPIFK